MSSTCTSAELLLSMLIHQVSKMSRCSLLCTRNLVLTTAILFWQLPIERIWSAPPTLDEIRHRVEFGRSKIDSGEIAIRGSIRVSDDDRSFAGDVSALYLFDFKNHKLLCDTEGPAGSVAGDKRGAIVRRVYGSYGDMTLFFSNIGRDSGGTLNIYDPGVLRDRSLAGSKGTWDVRALGIVPFWDMDRTIPFADAVDKFFNVTFGVDSLVTIDAGGIIQIRSFAENGNGRSTIWIDSARGFAPIKRIYEYGAKGLNSEFVVERIEQEYNLDWALLEGIWVPRSFSIDWLVPYFRSDVPQVPENISTKRTSESYTFEWVSLNETIDGSRFDYPSLNLPAGTYVWDMREGRKNLLEV